VSPEAQTLALAKEVMDILAARGVRTAVIGAVAVAIHGYPRGTEDLDLATNTSLETLREVASELEARRCIVKVGEPDPQDSLGGVLTITRDNADPVQLVNYQNPFRPGSGALAVEALESATSAVLGPLAVVDLPHLIALKLYAGGAKSQLDVVELLARNPSADRAKIQDVCARFGLATQWDAVCSW